MFFLRIAENLQNQNPYHEIQRDGCCVWNNYISTERVEFSEEKKKKSGGMEHIKEQVKTEKKKKSVLTCNMIFLQCQWLYQCIFPEVSEELVSGTIQQQMSDWTWKESGKGCRQTFQIVCIFLVCIRPN